MEWIIQPEEKKHANISILIRVFQIGKADANNTFMQNNMRMMSFCISNVLEFCPVLQIQQFQRQIPRWSRVILEEVPRFNML